MAKNKNNKTKAITIPVTVESAAEIGTALAACRKAAGLSQQAIAEATHRQQPAVARSEHGAGGLPSLRVIVDTVEVCGGSVELVIHPPQPR